MSTTLETVDGWERMKEQATGTTQRIGERKKIKESQEEDTGRRKEKSQEGNEEWKDCRKKEAEKERRKEKRKRKESQEEDTRRRKEKSQEGNGEWKDYRKKEAKKERRK
jgi:hypothetical protein